MNNDTEQYITQYSGERLQQKLKRYGRKAGMEVVERALTLYYTARAPEAPVWCKTALYGALGYFISLIDGIPDLTPVLGYTDDLAVMAAARSEEHTSELQSRPHLVCRLLLEKKKKK